MLIIKEIAALRDFVYKQKSQNKTIGFVPTMGYLHAGHAKLIEIAKKSCDVVIVSIFVNPLQFNVASDLTNYPRDLDTDAKLCKNVNVDVIFAPSEQEMYPHGRPNVAVTVNELDKNLCGATRPGHFIGVCTVVNKLFNIVAPNKAFFGRKDIQQLRIVETMVTELNFQIEVIGCDTVRADDGLALSSRNKHLSREEREAGIIVPNLLKYIVDLIEAGELNVANLLKKGEMFLDQCKIAKLDYLQIVNYDKLQLLDTVHGRIVIATAIFIGKTRLIDNIIYEVK